MRGESVNDDSGFQRQLRERERGREKEKRGEQTPESVKGTVQKILLSSEGDRQRREQNSVWAEGGGASR